MYVEDDPIEVGLLVNRFGLVSALPEGSGALPAPVEPLTEPTLEVVKPMGNWNGAAPNRKVIMLCGARGYVE